MGLYHLPESVVKTVLFNPMKRRNIMEIVNRPVRRKMCPPMAAQIKKLHLLGGLHQHEIAALVGVNQGRVSEVLTGKRFADIPPAV